MPRYGMDSLGADAAEVDGSGPVQVGLIEVGGVGRWDELLVAHHYPGYRL